MAPAEVSPVIQSLRRRSVDWLQDFLNNMSVMYMSDGWPPEFPKVMRFVEPKNPKTALEDRPWGILAQNPDYQAAKRLGDTAAAARLVKYFLDTPKNNAQLLTLQNKFPNAIIVPIHAEDNKSRNRIPTALAEYIAIKTGLEIDTNIIQITDVHRTGSGNGYRFAFRPEFDGIVQKDRNYLIVDDVFTLGGTINEMRFFIDRNGGHTVQAIAMALGGHGEDIALRPSTLKTLLDRHGEKSVKSFMEELNLYDSNYKNLTDPEAYTLCRVPSLDAARDRILAERQAGVPRVLQKSFRERETFTVTNDLPPAKPDRSLGR